MKKLNWKKASGEVIGFAVLLIFLTLFISQVVGLIIYVDHKYELNEAVMRIGRAVVTEESQEKAQEKAEKIMKAYMGDRKYMPSNEISISVDYAPGSKRIIVVSMVAHIKSGCFLTAYTTVVSTTIMIEQ